MQCSFTIIRLIRTLDTIFSIFMRRLSIYCWNINCYHISIIYSLSYIGNGLEMQNLFSIITSIYPFDMEHLYYVVNILSEYLSTLGITIICRICVTIRKCNILSHYRYIQNIRILYFVEKVVKILSKYSSTPGIATFQ